MSDEVTAAVAMLTSTQSAARRRGAKRLRKLRDCSGCTAVESALVRELKDPRTWETQYQMIMALGETGCRDSLPLLRRLADQVFDATMVYVAIGDAIVRLAVESTRDASPVLAIMRSARHPMLIDGAFRSMAMLRMVPEPAAIDEILKYVEPLRPEDGLRFWVAAAAPGWAGSGVDAFLRTCEASPRQDVRDAAASARARRYRTWKPL